MQTFRSLTTFFTQNLQIYKFCSTFATANQKFADILLKAFALFEDSFNLPHLKFRIPRIMRNAHVYTWAFLHILDTKGVVARMNQ